jgi:sterol desaturase/sphingolipid hydroxylase (fatty acid hydroxylase superfamily)
LHKQLATRASLGARRLQYRGHEPNKLPCLNMENQIVALIQVIIGLIVVVVLLWLINCYIPMAPSIKSMLNAVVLIVVVVWLLKIFGLWSYVTHLHVGR